MRLGDGVAALRVRLRPEVLDIQSRATGRVLDIRGPLASGFSYGSASELVVAPPWSLDERAAEPFDTICSFGAMAAAPCLERLVARLLRLSAPDGRLLFLELDGDARPWRRRLDGLARRYWGLSLGRHISGALWTGGYEVTSLSRYPAPGGPPGLLRAVAGDARPDPHRHGELWLDRDEVDDGE